MGYTKTLLLSFSLLLGVFLLSCSACADELDQLRDMESNGVNYAPVFVLIVAVTIGIIGAYFASVLGFILGFGFTLCLLALDVFGIQMVDQGIVTMPLIALVLLGAGYYYS